MTEAYQSVLKELFSNSILDIPQYQRAYAWDTKHVKDLLNDIDSLYGSLEPKVVSETDSFHYLGTVVLREREEVSVSDENFKRYDIIDGQQRLLTISLLISTINKKLAELEEELSESEFGEGERPPSNVRIGNEENYIKYAGMKRLNPKKINKSTFEELVERNRPPSETQARLSSQERLVDAKECVENWLENKLEPIQNPNEKFEQIIQLLNIINSDLEITVTEVTKTKEAGRLFEAINDRGKAINTIDKIRSYLIYCAAQLDNESLSEDIHSKITSVIESITEYGDDNDIDRFVREHWRIYSGEPYFDKNQRDDITELNRRLKKIHARTDRPDDELETWIINYLTSLEDMAHSFIEINNTEILENTYNDDVALEVAEKLNSINMFASKATKDPILLSTYHRLGVTQSLLDFLDLFEKYSFRVYQIAYHNASVNRKRFRTLASSIHWAERNSKFNEYFINDHELRGETFESFESGFNKLCQEVESLIGEYCPDEDLFDYLSRDDIYGNDQTQWSGVRKKKSIRYLLYEYEKYLREKGSKGSLNQLPAFNEWENQDVEIEHIHPENPSENSEYDLENEDLVQSVGNLALLAPPDNKDAKNSPFSIKREKVYSDSPMTMLENVAHEDSWTTSDIIDRRKKIVEFALERWGISTGANVHIATEDSSISIDTITSRSEFLDSEVELIRQIRQDYLQKTDFKYNISSVTFSTEGAGSWWETIRSCPDCDGTKVVISVSDEEFSINCSCGFELDIPSYKIRREEYSI